MTATGKVKYFDARKHYGWIIPDDGGPNVFFHETSAKGMTAGELKHWAPVEYEAVRTRRKPQATWVRKRLETAQNYAAAAD